VALFLAGAAARLTTPTPRIRLRRLALSALVVTTGATLADLARDPEPGRTTCSGDGPRRSGTLSGAETTAEAVGGVRRFRRREIKLRR
jgi:hypothetical protein